MRAETTANLLDDRRLNVLFPAFHLDCQARADDVTNDQRPAHVDTTVLGSTRHLNLFETDGCQSATRFLLCIAPVVRHSLLDTMKDCDTCGNEIADTAGVCRFCGSVQHVTSKRSHRAKIQNVNVETGLPSVEEGVARLKRDIASARHSGVRVLRVIHGWGSSGKGGKLRDACRSFLSRELQAKRLKLVLPGDEYSRRAIAGRDLMSRYEDLKSSERSDSQNPGITMVEL